MLPISTLLALRARVLLLLGLAACLRPEVAGLAAAGRVPERERLVITLTPSETPDGAARLSR